MERSILNLLKLIVFQTTVTSLGRHTTQIDKISNKAKNCRMSLMSAYCQIIQGTVLDKDVTLGVCAEVESEYPHKILP